MTLRRITTLLLSATMSLPFPAMAEPDWRMVPGVPSKTHVWVDVSSLVFDSSTVVASAKWKSESGSNGFTLISFNCAGKTGRGLGGQRTEADGKTSKVDPDDKPVAAPSGTVEGTVLSFVCEQRPAWRKLLQ